MYKQKLCLSTNSTFGIPESEQVRLFRKIGFEGFNVLWGYMMDDVVEACARVAREENMIFQSIHAPWNMCQAMWDESRQDEAREGIEQLKHCLDLCKKYGVPIMVCHVYVGFDEEYKANELGVKNYGEIIRHAEKLGIKIAFENTEGIVYLKAVLDSFKDSPAVGFCWDSGHEMCYNFSENLLAEYGDRLIATHINDNLGVKDFGGKITWHDDLHLLPFDGIADWDELTQRIADCGYGDILTFELNIKSKPNRHENDKYDNMPLEEYLSEAYARACRIAMMIQKKRK
ncbi:MAG: sugar phosphate isomerase/epimerase [Clostridia bacterium]|nr:sugar phosphate isomerase/epimerase [Clostridia bacterium]